MTTTAAFPTATSSLLAPVLIGLTTTEHDAEHIENAWLAATLSIPMTRPVLKVAGAANTKAQPVSHLRLMAHGTGGNTYQHIARLCDRRPDEGGTTYWPRWRWELGLRRTPNNDHTKLIGIDRTALRLDVLSYRLTEGLILEAHQLALFRHYVIAGLQAIDPSLILHGGQHDWHDNWWPDTQLAGSR